jgi:hypothetical protein
MTSPLKETSKGAEIVKRAFVLAAALSLAPAIASAEFEGVASFKMTTGSGPGMSAKGDGKIFLSPAGYRVEWMMDLSSMKKDREGAGAAPPTMAMTMLARKADPGKVYMLNAAKKTYSVVDTGKSVEQRGKTRKEPFTVKKLGTDTVAGLPCQNVLLTSSDGTEIEVCAAKELAASSDWLASLNRRSPEGAAWLTALKKQGIEGFPVRWVTRKKGSTQPLTTMEMTHLEKKALPASLFDVPAGYTQTQFAGRGLTPEQEKALSQMRGNMTPEQRKAREDAMKRRGQPTPKP